MRIRKYLVILVGWCVWSACFPSLSFGFNYRLGTEVLPKPNLAKPAKGQSVVDPNTGITITRVSDAAAEVGTNMVTPAYSVQDIENFDGSWVILSLQAYKFYLYHGPNSTTPWKFERAIDPTVLGWSSGGGGGHIEPRWHPTNPDVFYYILPGHGGDSGLKSGYAATFRKYNVSTNTQSLVHDFKNDYPGATNVYSQHEGDPSEDGRYWAFQVEGNNTSGNGTVTIFDKDFYGEDNGKVIKEWVNAPELDPVDNVRLSPSGKYLYIMHGSPIWAKFYRVSDFPNTVWNVSGSHSHGEWGKLSDGTEVLWFQNSTLDTYSYHDPSTMSDTTVSPIDADCNFSAGGCPGIHPAGSNLDRPGWGVSGTYGNIGNWSMNQLFMVELKPPSQNPRVWRICHHQSTTSSYWSQMQPPINRAGTRIYFSSDWGNSSGPIDTYVAELPSTWYEDLTGGTPGNIRPSATASASPIAGISPLTVNFLGSGNDPDGSIVSYSWDFGDGGTSTEQNPTYIYNNSGNYSATLTVTDNADATATASVAISVGTPIVTNSFITSYDFNDADAATIASRYDIIVTSTNEAAAVSTMKTVNPAMKAFYYKDALAHGASHFVLDTVSGKKIVHDNWGWSLHDISDAAYRATLANDIASNLATYSQFDGVFLDDVWHSIIASDFHQEGTSTDPNLPPDLVANWQTHMVSLIRAVKTAVGSKLLILNCPWYRTNYLAEADGMMDEWYAHANWQGPTEFYDTSSWKSAVDALVSAAVDNKYYLAQSGVSDGATSAQIDKLVLYTFSSFLMAIPPNNDFAKHYFIPSLYYNNYYWYSVWQINLGEPVGPYFEVQGTIDCYRRDFENGLVLVNPTDNGISGIDLGDTFYTLNYNPVTTVNLTAREGIILLNSPPPLSINNLSAASGLNYEIIYGGLQVGALVYTDRSYTFSGLQTWLQGATYIKTANEDKSSSGTSFITFDVNQNVTVYVAHDDRILTKPNWLQSFVDIGEDIVTSQLQNTTMSLFSKNFSPGSIVLGGNGGTANESMYSIIIVPQAGTDTTLPAVPTGLVIKSISK